MTRKFTLLAMGISVIAALAVPATASSAPSLTMPAGTLVPNGTGLTAASTNTVITTELGNLTCANIALKAEVTENSGSSVKAVGVGEGTASTCKLGTNEVKVTHHTVNSITTITGGHAYIHTTIKFDLPGGLTCHFETTSIGGVLTYSSGSSSYHVAGSLIASPELCGEETSISGDYSLTTTSGGGSVILD